MTMHYSNSPKGFYDSSVHASIPDGAVAITEAEHIALLEAQSQGKIIQSDENGKPVAVDPEPPTLDELRAVKLTALDKEKRRVKDGGFMVVVDGVDVLFDSDAAARTAYLEFNALLGMNPEYSEEWKASGDTWVTLDASLFAKVIEASKQHTSCVFSWLKQRQAEVAAAATVEEIQAVDVAFVLPSAE